MLPRAALIRKISDLEPRLREVVLLLLDEMERQREQLAQQVTKAEFNELKAIVTELAEAQKRTEERLTRLEETVAQLAEAQKRTEEEVRHLATALRETRQRVEAISDTVGYTLEDRAIRSLPKILPKYGIEVEGELARKRVWLRGKERQINIYGHGRREGEPVLIVGEAKVRPSRREVDRFVRLASRLAEQEGKNPVLLFVAYDFPLAVEAYLRERDILPIISYQLDL